MADKKTQDEWKISSTEFKDGRMFYGIEMPDILIGAKAYYLILAAPNMLSALKEAPDPHREGFCESCFLTPRQLPLKHDGNRHFFQHDDSCWYGKIQSAIAKAEGK